MKSQGNSAKSVIADQALVEEAKDMSFASSLSSCAGYNDSSSSEKHPVGHVKFRPDLNPDKEHERYGKSMSAYVCVPNASFLTEHDHKEYEL